MENQMKFKVGDMIAFAPKYRYNIIFHIQRSEIFKTTYIYYFDETSKGYSIIWPDRQHNFMNGVRIIEN